MTKTKTVLSWWGWWRSGGVLRLWHTDDVSCTRIPKLLGLPSSSDDVKWNAGIMKHLRKIASFASLFTFCVTHAPRTSAGSPLQNQPSSCEAKCESIPPEKLKADLSLLFKTIERVHPNLYAYTSKAQHLEILHELYKNCVHAGIWGETETDNEKW